ncbi:Aldehyde dehydrogenase family 3 member B1 [Orchesella cincta]|uniref:Aldehyde dehydrogenase n=1 Tax=Orchesella cincta TaxID=48709 RepID=A0A1D2NBD9_ORCCI|nr:Aldehyde dehydrogenase family 3 member B1 [Orchesella cincta]
MVYANSHVIDMEKLRRHEQTVEDLRDTFLTGKTRDVEFRLKQLKNLLRLYSENWDRIADALCQDLRKPLGEAKIMEHAFLIGDVKYAIKNLKKWAKSTAIPTCLANVSDNAWYRYEPFGTVLIIGPWNYPFMLAFMPLCAAIAAGNCAVIKPSELSPNSAAVIADLVPKYLDRSCYKVVTGGPEAAQELLEEKWDFIFYTGSTTIGKVIYSAAAKSLTPVCLELGGKSPVYVDNTADMKKTAQRILWAKCANLGQTCIAPDYIICTKEVEDNFIQECRQILRDYYGTNLKASKDLARIVNKRHFYRILKYLAETKGTIALGGENDERELWIEPTILVGVDPTEPIMSEEIFGPILPICRVGSADEAINFINRRPRPLALYVFTNDSNTTKKFVKFTHSGSICVNDCLYQSSLHQLPFGGVGDSGMGQYHGQFGFQTFSRPRAVMERSFSNFENMTAYKLRHPPYLNSHIKLNSWVVERFDMLFVNPWPYIPYLVMFILGLLVMFSLQRTVR